MTTEGTPRASAPTGLEAKLLLVTALGAIYTAAWLALAEPAPRASAPALGRPREAAAVARAPVARKAPRVRTRSS